MNTSDYLKRMAALGISRGAFAEGFVDETVRDQKAPRVGFTNQPIGKREEPGRAPDEDLSALNDKRWRDSSKAGRKGGRNTHARGGGRDGGKPAGALRANGG